VKRIAEEDEEQIDKGVSPVNRTLKTLYFLGMLAEMVIRVPYERQRRHTTMVVDRVDWSERSLLGLMFVGMFFIPAVYVLTSRFDRADYRLPQEARGITGGAGVAILTVAVWLFWRSHADLGRNWSPRSSYERDTSSSQKACIDLFGTRCTLRCGCGA
jgi:protein-S-isoprenylcysteine O-methyltransferase Ste14